MAKIPARILLIDDNASVLRAAERALKTRGYHVTAYTDAAQAFRVFFKEHFDLVVSDYNMEEMSGIGILQALRTAKNTVPFILCTGTDNLALREEAKKLDAHFLLKPGDLPAKVAEVLVGT